MIPQVHEGEVLTVLPAGGHPAAQGHGLADVYGPEFAALVRTHSGGGHDGSTRFSMGMSSVRGIVLWVRSSPT